LPNKFFSIRPNEKPPFDPIGKNLPTNGRENC
jgi:hypothetical protein